MSKSFTFKSGKNPKSKTKKARNNWPYYRNLLAHAAAALAQVLSQRRQFTSAWASLLYHSIQIFSYHLYHRDVTDKF